MPSSKSAEEAALRRHMIYSALCQHQYYVLYCKEPDKSACPSGVFIHGAYKVRERFNILMPVLNYLLSHSIDIAANFKL